MNNDENEVTEMWRDLRHLRQEKRSRNRDSSAKLLEESKIPYTSHNGDAHLIVGDPPKFDFWPGTGKWIERGTGKKGRGVFSLIRKISDVAKSAGGRSRG